MTQKNYLVLLTMLLLVCISPLLAVIFTQPSKPSLELTKATIIETRSTRVNDEYIYYTLFEYPTGEREERRGRFGTVGDVVVIRRSTGSVNMLQPPYWNGGKLPATEPTPAKITYNDDPLPQ